MLIKIVHELRKAQGRNAKLAILEKHKDNEKWKKFLVATYDQSISYGVSAPKSPDFDEEIIDNGMFAILQELADRKVTGNKAKAAAKWLSESYGEIPRLVLGRSIKAGVSVTTINNVYDGLIKVFETMKGKDVLIKEYPVKTSIKYDGCKVFASVRPGVVVLQTSSGTPFRLRSLENELSRASYGIYEGELIAGEGKQKDRPIITGWLNSLLSRTKTDLPLGKYSYAIYDYIRFKEWNEKKGEETFLERQQRLDTLFSLDIPDSAILERAEHHLISDEESLIFLTNHLIDEGWEGTMSRYDDDPYMFTGDKRTDRLIKKKANKEAILLCIGTTPHTNQLKGVTGSLLCEGYVESKQYGRVFVKVNVGSGLSKFDILRDEDYYLDQDIEIEYNTETETENGYSLFLPRFKRVVGKDNI